MPPKFDFFFYLVRYTQDRHNLKFLTQIREAFRNEKHFSKKVKNLRKKEVKTLVELDLRLSK